MKQRLAVWAASLLVVLGVAGLVWQRDPKFPRLHLREPVLTLPDPNAALNPSPGGRFLLIVIENTPPARPQSGLADACLVYAVPTEARITRFLAAYCRARPRLIGPVRSVRRYMLDIASDLGAILVHAGHSEEARRLIRDLGIPVVNEFTMAGPFWRDRAREMPHNLYTGIDRLESALQTKPSKAVPRGLPFSFAYEGTVERTGRGATTVALDYGPGYAVRYAFQASTRRYMREQDGKPHLDADGRQISAATVLTVFIRWQDILVNGNPSSKIDLAGSGRLAITTGGRLVEGRWSRPPRGPLAFADADGRAPVLPPGPVWIELFPVDRPFEVSP